MRERHRPRAISCSPVTRRLREPIATHAENPWHRGAYSYWRLGRYTAFSGYEGVQEGNIHFAGGHTDPREQVFLNGAVTSGERAASEVLHQIRTRAGP
jgi:monoamine oxidase